MKKCTRLILIAIFLIASYLPIKASIMGSDMGWSCLGGDSFLIRVAVYNDCNGTTMGSISVAFKCFTTGATITTLSMSVPSSVDITPVCSTICTRCDSSTCTFPYGINKYTYMGIVRLNAAGSCCNIKMQFSSGTRNSSITTGAAGAAFYTDAMMNRCQNPCDYSPQFTNAPVQIVCVGQDYTFNHGMIDSNIINNGANIDSFTYEWSRPMSASNSYISYTGQYTYYRPVYFWGFPNDALPFPRGLHLDQQTGDIHFRPMKAEVTVMVVQLNEFRNGVKIAEVRRDIQMIIINCPSNNPPSLSTPNNVRSKSVCSGSPVSFTFTTNDPNAGDTIRISWNNGISGASWTTTNGQTKHPSATLTWTPGNSHVSSLPYTFTVTARDNACPINAQYTQAYQIWVKPNPRANIIVTDKGCGSHQFLAQRIIGSGPTYLWQGQSFSFSPNTGAVVNHNFVPGTYPYSMTMLASGCSTTYIDTLVVYPPLLNSLYHDTDVCYGSTVSLNSFVIHSKGPIKMSWGSANYIYPDDSTYTKEITVTSDTLVWSVATDSLGCKSADTVLIKIHKPIGLTLGPDVNICTYDIAALNAGYDIDSNAIWNIIWKENAGNSIVSTKSWLTTADTGFYSCTVSDTFGCTAYDTVHLEMNPQITANATGQTICLGNEAELIADSTGGSSTKYEWYDGKLMIGTNRKCRIKPVTTKNYLLKVNETINGKSCSDSFITTIIVLPIPVLTFEKFDKYCEGGEQIYLDSFVKVNNQNVSDGTWTCPDEPSQVASNIFFMQSAYANLNPGYKLVYDYTDNNTGCSNSDTVSLLVYPQPPTPGITINGDTIFCNGYSVSLSSSTTAKHYGWTSGDTVKQITITTSGIFKLAVTGNNGCVSDSSIPVKIVVNPKPPTPVISLSPSDSFLECNLIDGFYEWYFRPDTISSPTIINNSTKKINPKLYCTDCYFNIFFTDTNGCISNSSAFYHFHNNSIDYNYQLSGIKFYPNPAHSKLFIENPFLKTSSIILTNILGNILLQTTIIPGKNELSLTNFKPGIYFIFMDGNITGKLLIE